ncbi:MAG: hypothetical protein ABR562_03230 [Thermoplasmatota archaeon]|nr:hypothetical protein [Halobacteriales archaeon]
MAALRVAVTVAAAVALLLALVAFGHYLPWHRAAPAAAEPFVAAHAWAPAADPIPTPDAGPAKAPSVEKVQPRSAPVLQPEAKATKEIHHGGKDVLPLLGLGEPRHGHKHKAHGHHD